MNNSKQLARAVLVRTGLMASVSCSEMNSSEEQTNNTENKTENPLTPSNENVQKIESPTIVTSAYLSVSDDMSIDGRAHSGTDSDSNLSDIILSRRKNRKRHAPDSPTQHRHAKTIGQPPISKPNAKIAAASPLAKYRIVPTAPLVTQNRFDSPMLHDREVIEPTQNTAKAPQTKITSQNKNSNAISTQIKKEHVPPITITQTFSVDDANKMWEAGSFEIRRIANGVKIHAASMNDFSLLKEYCLQNKIEFFTHPPRNTGKLCVVLKGIDGFSTQEITDELEKTGIPPIAVRTIPTKREFVLFGVDFSKATISFAKLNAEHSRLLHHRVVWEATRKRNAGPTICQNCCMLGHGMQSCHRPSVCMFCALNHRYSECPDKITNTDEHKDKMRCINCHARNLSSDHPANSPSCPVRIQFIESSKNNANLKKTAPKEPRPQRNLKDWPNLTPAKQTRLAHKPRASTSHKPLPGASFNHPSYANATRKTYEQAPSSNELFTIEEIVDITFEAVNALQRCTTRFDQIRVITQLLQKCLSD